MQKTLAKERVFLAARKNEKTKFGENTKTTDTFFFAIQPKRGGTFCVTRPAAAPASQGGFGWGTAPGNRSRYKPIGPIIASSRPPSYLPRPDTRRRTPHPTTKKTHHHQGGNQQHQWFRGGRCFKSTTCPWESWNSDGGEPQTMAMLASLMFTIQRKGNRTHTHTHTQCLQRRLTFE